MREPDQPGMLLSVVQAAALLGVTESFMRDLLTREQDPIPHFRQGRRNYIKRPDLEKWVGGRLIDGLEPTSQEGPGVRVSVGLNRKVGLPQYGSAEANIHLSGLTADTTDDEIDDALDTARLAWDHMRERLNAKVAEVYKAEVNKYQQGGK